MCEKMSAVLSENMNYLNDQLKVNENFDVVYRVIRIGGREACMYFIDGFCKDELMQIRQEVDRVFVKDELVDYIVQLCGATRNDSRILQGASPRASLALTSLSKATAWIQGRDYVLPRDVRFVFRDCIEHRLLWSDAADSRGHADIVRGIMNSVKAPNI